MASQSVHAGTATVQVLFSTEKQRLQMALCTLGPTKWTQARLPNARFSVNSCSCNRHHHHHRCSCLIRDCCAMFGERIKTGKLSPSVKRPLWNDLWFTSRKQTGRSCGRRRACFTPPTTPVNGTCSPPPTATMSDPAPSTGTDAKSVCHSLCPPLHANLSIIQSPNRVLGVSPHYSRYFCRGTPSSSM